MREVVKPKKLDFARCIFEFMQGKGILLCARWITLFGIVSPVQSQDTLPRFSLHKISEDRVLIQWKNPDTALRQLSIQQSTDSTTGFRTTLTMLDPELPQNGTVLFQPKASSKYYRLYLLYPRGKYVFTASKQASPPPAVQPVNRFQPDVNRPNPTTSKIDPQKPVDLSKTTAPIPKLLFRNDSLNSGELVSTLTNTAEVNPPTGKSKINSSTAETKKQNSPFVFMQTDGYPFLNLPADWNLAEVEIRFFQENGELLFELNNPPIRSFRIDKTIFHRSGWYKFEIWRQKKKVETNRLFIPLTL